MVVFGREIGPMRSWGLLLLHDLMYVDIADDRWEARPFDGMTRELGKCLWRFERRSNITRWVFEGYI
jgi:hypothetical protein